MNSYVLVALAASIVAVASAVDPTCYVCNSAAKNSEKCKSSEIGDLSTFKKACKPLTAGSLKGKTSNGCRKVHQDIGGVETIIRECAYSGEDVDGQRRTGNSGIKLFFYQCSNENPGAPCNAGSSIAPITALIAALVARYLF